MLKKRFSLFLALFLFFSGAVLNSHSHHHKHKKHRGFACCDCEICAALDTVPAITSSSNSNSVLPDGEIAQSVSPYEFSPHPSTGCYGDTIRPPPLDGF